MVGNRRAEADISEFNEVDNVDKYNKVDNVDAATAAIRERARAALLVACDGWRERGRCTAPDGTRVAHPHPGCLTAQYRHELILLENGITR